MSILTLFGDLKRKKRSAQDNFQILNNLITCADLI